jgi:cellobiose phosphorylase
MHVRVRNTGRDAITFVPTYAVPVYGRSADNLRSHRDLTSLLNRVAGTEYGFRFTPTMSFDERGHRLNTTSYFVIGAEGDGRPPAGGWASRAAYCGPRHGLERPAAVFEDLAPRQFGETFQDGREAVGALRFSKRTLASGATAEYVVALAVADRPALPELESALSAQGVAGLLEQTRAFWSDRLNRVQLRTGDGDFDQWFRWVQYQPFLRRMYGCSFMPEHDYGRGGRGWRDLWQDLLGILTTEPETVREELVRYFAGIRWDGSNATIIGEQPGEFIADRDNISRVWSDHGSWPWRTVKLYIDQTGDGSILAEKVRYWKDRQVFRAQGIDAEWTPADGTWQKDADGNVVEGTVLEHILLQHYVSFFHVGPHDILLLEGADWNDGTDMARQHGETVHFYAVYGGNMLTLAETLEHMEGRREIDLPVELVQLMALGDETLLGGPDGKRAHLARFFDAVTPLLSGRRARIRVQDLIADLRLKARSIFERIRANEWVTTSDGHSFFNAYYDEKQRRVDGDNPARGRQMNLAAQAMTMLAGLPDREEVSRIVDAVAAILDNNITGLPALCTDTGGPYMELGRNFGYAYGYKENGAPFCHMIVMYAAGLLECGAPAEACRVLRQLYEAAMSDAAQMLPGIPEYFEPDGRGAYCYLTGSAAWFVHTLLTLVVGVRGRFGDLVLNPLLAPGGIDPRNWSLRVPFAERSLVVRFAGSGTLVSEVRLDGEPAAISRLPGTPGAAVVPRNLIAALAPGTTHELHVALTDGAPC